MVEIRFSLEYDDALKNLGYLRISRREELRGPYYLMMMITFCSLLSLLHILASNSSDCDFGSSSLAHGNSCDYDIGGLWKLLSGPTPSYRTGPSDDADKGSGFYIYVIAMSMIVKYFYPSNLTKVIKHVQRPHRRLLGWEKIDFHHLNRKCLSRGT